jgi:dTDP-glucose 4,6-dehydratase/UDP-glucose 4-epimerase
MTFRPHNVYGPDMGWEHVLPQFIGRAVETIAKHPAGKLPFPIQGDGAQTRAFIYIDDFADAFMKIMEKGQHLGIYHIGNPEELTIAQVASQVVSHFGREIDLQAGPAAPGGTLRRCPDITKLRSLGFEPRTPFAAGLAPTADWYARNQHLRLAAA